MAKIVDPDAIEQTTDVVYDTTLKEIELKITGAIDDDSPGKTSGITGRCLYSFSKEEWKTTAALNKFKFPIKMIYEASFQLINGWSFKDQQSMDVIRDAGFQDLINVDDYSCIISLGNMDAPAVDQAYYANVVGFDQTTTTFDKTGELNENIIIDDDTTDTRDYLKLFLREQGKLYAEYNLHSEQGLSVLGFEAYKLPLSNGNDLKITDSDATIDGANDPYQNMSVDYLVGIGFTTAAVQSYVIDDVVQDTAGRWAICTVAGTLDAAGVADYTTNGGTSTFVAYAGERQIGTPYYAFNRIIDGDNVNTATGVQSHSWAQRQLRKTSDINANTHGDGFGTVNGNIAVPFTSYIGDQLHTNPGTFIDYLHADDNNSVSFWDITVDGGGLDSITSVPLTSTERQNPFFASFTLQFSSNLVAETAGDTLFRVYFTNDDVGDNTGRDFDTSTAIVVQDKDLADVEDGGSGITQQDYVFQYDYTNNVQRGGASAGEDAPITVVFQGLDKSEWTSAAFIIGQSTGQIFACNAADELNYDNP